MNMKVALVLVNSALVGLTVFGQQLQMPSHVPIKYENRNQVEPKPLATDLVSGRVVVTLEDVNGAARDIGAVTEARVGLFTEKDHALVTIARVDSDGRFILAAVPDGEYRLVVRADPLCVANVRLSIVRSKRLAQKHKQIVIHMRPAGNDTCSYADYK
ncbi:MAG: hypothetical protein JWM21_3284 [Acidobacteria bacterium]|nr:hypothetical protein [Acidobacteriota bacterium]